ncbi:hypothetical protein AHAS_Ahas12G0129100 [Arachis hypogaea]
MLRYTMMALVLLTLSILVLPVVLPPLPPPPLSLLLVPVFILLLLFFLAFSSTPSKFPSFAVLFSSMLHGLFMFSLSIWRGMFLFSLVRPYVCLHGLVVLCQNIGHLSVFQNILILQVFEFCKKKRGKKKKEVNPEWGDLLV